MPLILTLAFVAATLWVGAWKRAPASEFFLAGRRAGGAVVAGSLLATCLGGSALLGIVGKAYERGWSAFWWLGAGAIGLFLLGLLWARPMRSGHDTKTLPEWAGQTYGAPARVLSGLLIVLMWVGVIAAQLVAAGALLSGLLRIPVGWSIAAAAGVTVLYTCRGGQQSVLRTDVLQVFFIFAAVLLPVLFLHRLPLGPLSMSRPTWRALFPADLGPGRWLALVTVVGGMYIVGPDLCSRVLVARDARSARHGAWMAAAGLLLCSVLVTLLGIALRHSGVVVTNASNALPTLIGAMFPGVTGTILMLGLLAALLSSADTCLMTAASIWELDLSCRRRSEAVQAKRARIYIVLVAIVAGMVAWLDPRIIANIMRAYALYAGGLLAPLLLLRFPRIARRIARPFVWTGIVVGALVPAILLVLGLVHTEDFMLTLATAGGIGALACGAIMLVGAILAVRL